MSRAMWAWARPIGGAAIIAVLVWRLGTGPILHGLRTVDGWSLLAAAAITLVTSVFSAWRWSIVARGLGVGVPLAAATGAYYRSQFLNTALPCGVLGDVHRGLRHGREVGDVGRGLRAVVWERGAGQAVQVALTLAVLLVLPSPVRGSMPVVVPAVAAGLAAAVLVLRALPRQGRSRWARGLRAAGADIRHGLLARRAWPGVVLASIVVVCGHAATFLIAARTAGSTASVAQLLPLTLLVLLAMALPTNVGGWGPREGVAAVVFGAAGLGADQGVATATVYGVLVLVASLPGAVVLAADSLRRRRQRPERPVVPAPQRSQWPQPDDAGPRVPVGAAHG
jgi:glycosyltransferase 2 family protein